MERIHHVLVPTLVLSLVSAGCGVESPADPEVDPIPHRPAWTIQRSDGGIVARHIGSDLVLEVDPTDEVLDGRWSGIYARKGGAYRFAGQFLGHLASMFSTARPYESRSEVGARADGKALEVTMSSWTSRWQVADGGLYINLTGLYYILLPKQGTAVTLLDQDSKVVAHLRMTATTGPTKEDYGRVRWISVESKTLGSFVIETNARIVQVEVKGSKKLAETLFEIDFDHSCSGPCNNTSRLFLPLAH